MSCSHHATQQAAAEAAGIEWRPNAWRPTLASCRKALTEDAGKLARDCRHWPAITFRNYRQLVRPEAAGVWFAVAPSAPPTNIMSFAAT